MRVDVIVNQIKLSISCGTGQQSFHWLATVIQERLKQFHLMRKTLEPETFIVTEIRNTENELINPKDKIFEHASSGGLTVKATITNSFPVDEWETPKFNDWMQVAYLHSASNQVWSKEMEAWRSNLEGVKQNANQVFGISSSEAKRIDVNATLLAAKAIPHSARLIKIGFDFTEADVELAFNLDWQIMSWSWISPSLSEIARSKLGDVLKLHYSLICNLFAHYAGVAKVGQRYGMTLEELGHLFHFLRLFDWKQDEERVEQIVAATSTALREGGDGEKKSSSSSSRWLLITRAHLTQILVFVALRRTIREEEEGERATTLTADQAARELLEGPLNDLWDLLTTSYLQYSSPEATLRKSFFEYYYLLRNVFTERARIDSRFGARLSFRDFFQMMRDCSLVDSLASSDGESLCATCFLQAQLSPRAEEQQEELDSLVFIEFVEAISRLALRAIESYSGLTEGKRIRMAFNMISELSSDAEAKK